MKMSHRIVKSADSKHAGHKCRLLPLGPRKRAHQGIAVVACECGVDLTVPVRQLRRLQGRG